MFIHNKFKHQYKIGFHALTAAGFNRNHCKAYSDEGEITGFVSVVPEEMEVTAIDHGSYVSHGCTLTRALKPLDFKLVCTRTNALLVSWGPDS